MLRDAVKALPYGSALDVEPYRERFLDLVAARTSGFERDALIAAGHAVFGYRLADALRAVETHVLERMAT